MPFVNPPIRYQDSLEFVPKDERETQDGLMECMLSIARRTAADTGHAHRAVHAKAHGYVKARFEVLPDLEPQLAQGLFAEQASYDAIFRFSTTPGDILNDNISAPRGAALKVLKVVGARLQGSETDTSQNYVLGNSPAFQVGTAKAFLKQLKVLASTTGHFEPVKHAVSVLTRTAESVLEAVGGSSATLTTLAGQAATHLLGESFYSQAALLHGQFYGKIGIFPVSSELLSLKDKHLDLSGHPDAIQESIRSHLSSTASVWELRVQLATNINSMPVEDASASWPEEESPYVPVARITASPQDSWDSDLGLLVEEHLAFDPWIGLDAHRPLGSIMRARQLAYSAARQYRARFNNAHVGDKSDNIGF